MDRDLKKKALCGMTGISASTISEMVKGEKVSMDIVSRIFEKFRFAKLFERFCHQG